MVCNTFVGVETHDVRVVVGVPCAPSSEHETDRLLLVGDTAHLKLVANAAERLLSLLEASLNLELELGAALFPLAKSAEKWLRFIAAGTDSASAAYTPTYYCWLRKQYYVHR